MKKLIVIFVLSVFHTGMLWSQGIDPVKLNMEVVPRTFENNNKGLLLNLALPQEIQE